MPNQSGKIVLILVLLLLILGASAYFFLPSFKEQKYQEVFPNPSIGVYQNSKEASKSSKLTKDYYSKDFKMFLKTPSNFQAEDKFPIFILRNGDKKIEIVRNGTNFANLNDYIKDFDAKRKVKEIDREELDIKGYPTIKRLVVYGDSNTRQRSIYLYVDNYVYIFSTSDESLYPVLDKIVQSFEYKP